MKYAKIVNGIVSQVQPNQKVGFIEVPDSVVCGMVDNGDGTFRNPPKTLDELKVIKITELYTAYDTDNQLDITYLGTTFQADKDSQNMIVSVLSAGSVPTGFYWVDATNNKVPMTYAGLQGMSGTILARSQTNFDKLQTLKAQTLAAITEADLALITW